MLTGWGLRRVTPGRAHVVADALAADPIAGCVLAEGLEGEGLARMGGHFYGLTTDPDALVYLGGNAMPVRGSADELAALGRLLGRRPRPASVLGRAELVLPLWSGLAAKWGPVRELRENQPLLDCLAPPLVAPDPTVRRAAPADFEAYFPAAVQMFTSEVGVSPILGGEGPYRERVGWLIRTGRAFARFDDGQVSFKAEIGSLSRTMAMIQGVWVAPHLRGRGIGVAGIAAVVAEIQRRGRTPCLYVNDYNTAARAIYQRVGFRQIGTFASVLF